MSEPQSLEGRVAVVTGAGRGLGLAYAQALARHGAQVIVNDLGVDVHGHGGDAAVAEAAAAAIRAAGGSAEASGADISTPAGGKEVVAQAIDAFGKLDIVVNNAGILQAKPFGETTAGDFDAHMRIYLGGHINVTQAAWPHMLARGYGRVIMTESGAGLYGLRNHTAYAAAKGAIHGLMRALAHEGREAGILVNAVSPGGFSRMHEAANLAPEMLEWTRRVMAPELVAPFVVWLASAACASAGQVYSVWAGRIARVQLGSGSGFVTHDMRQEVIAAHLADIEIVRDVYEPADSVDEISRWVPPATA